MCHGRRALVPVPRTGGAQPPRTSRDGEPRTSGPPAPGDQLRGCCESAAAAVRLNSDLSH